jgi:hypothetical protein
MEIELRKQRESVYASKSYPFTNISIYFIEDDDTVIGILNKEVSNVEDVFDDARSICETMLHSYANVSDEVYTQGIAKSDSRRLWNVFIKKKWKPVQNISEYNYRNVVTTDSYTLTATSSMSASSISVWDGSGISISNDCLIAASKDEIEDAKITLKLSDESKEEILELIGEVIDNYDSINDGTTVMKEKIKDKLDTIKKTTFISE